MELTISDFLKIIDDRQEVINMQTVIFRSDRSLKAKTELLEQLKTQAINLQIAKFEDLITQIYDKDRDCEAFYQAIADAYAFAAEHGLRLKGEFHWDRYKFTRVREAGRVA